MLFNSFKVLIAEWRIFWNFHYIKVKFGSTMAIVTGVGEQSVTAFK